MEHRMNKIMAENELLLSSLNYKLVWIAGILSGIIALYLKLSPRPVFYEHWSAYSLMGMLVESAVFWMIISRMFNSLQKAAINALYVSLGVVLLQFLVHKIRNGQVNNYLEPINFVLAVIPAAFFFNSAGKITGKSLLAVVAIAALSIVPVIATALTNMDLFFFRFRSGYAILFAVLKAVFVTMAFIFLKVEIVKQVLFFPRKEFKDTYLNLDQEYPRSQYLVLYIATRLALDITAFGFIRILALGNYENSGAGPMNYFSVLITWMITMFLLAWLNRKYLIEYLLTYNKVPSFLYWSLVIPFINLIVFLLSYFFIKNRIDVDRRKENLRNALSMNSYEHIGYIIILLQGFSLFISVAKLEWMHIFTRSVSFFLFIYFMKGKNLAFYILMGFNLALLFILALPSNLAKDIDTDLYVSLPLSLVAIYLMYGIFYIDRFSAEPVPDVAKDNTVEMQESLEN